MKNGTITASTILGKLNTYSYKNKLYQAFRELGRVIRTGFLLQYVGNPELRAIIQRETNKSESLNGFAKWLAFGNGGVIPTNNRREMWKYLKYNHLLANLVIFANVAILTQAMNELVSEGHRIDPEVVAFLSPYITQHLVRFGLYQVDHTRPPDPLTYEVAIPNPEESLAEVSEVVSADERTALSKWPKFVRTVVVPQNSTWVSTILRRRKRYMIWPSFGRNKVT